jgi:WD40 repeat protein/Tfp pilus assembly protein PilF
MVAKKYDAFLSYKHGSILPFAQMLARSLRTYATGVFSRPRNIFRDEDHLLPDASLPEVIHRALENSIYLVLLASPEAARSPWVERELRIWCEDLGRMNRIVILLLDGSIEVDSSGATIDWERTNAIPPVLREYLADVPFFIDLRELRSERDLNERNPVFKAAVAKIVARFLGVDVHELIGYEIALYRRRIRIRNGGIAALATLTVISTFFGIYASKQRNEQEKATYAAFANSLSSQVRPDSTHGQDERNALLARQAYLFTERSGKPLSDSVNRALQTALSPDYFTTSRSVGPGFVSHLATGAGGRVLAAGGDFNRVRVWDERLPAGSMTLTLETGAQVSALAFDPQGRRLAVAVREDGSVRLWNLDGTGSTRLAATFMGSHGITSESLVFDAEGNRLAAGSTDGRVRIWKVAEPSGEPLILRHSETVVAARFVGDEVLTATQTGDIQAWSRDGVTMTRLHEHEGGPLEREPLGLPGVDISNSGRWVALSRFGETEARVYDLRNPSAAPVVLKSPADAITALAFAPTEDRIAAGTSSGDIVIWKPDAKDHVTTIGSGHGTGVTNIVFVDGPGIASAGQQDGQIRLRYLKPVAIISTTLKEVSQPRFSTTDDRILVVDRKSSRPAVRDLSDAVASSIGTGIPESPGCAWYTSKTGFVSMNFSEKTGALWPATAGAVPLRRFRFTEYGGERVDSVAVSDDGRLLAWIDRLDMSVWLVDFADPNPAAFSLRDRPIQKTIRFSIAADGSPTSVISSGTRDWWPPLAISADGKRIAVGVGDGSVRVWTVADRKAEPLVLTGFGGWPLSLAFSGDGGLLAVGGTDRTVGIWSFADRRNLATLRGHEGRVDAVAFAPNRRLLASGGTDRTVRLWDLAFKDPLPALLEESDPLDALEFSPSGQKLLVSEGTSAHVRTVAADALAEEVCRVVSRNLSLEEWRGLVGQDFEYERTCDNLPVHPSLLETAQTLATSGARDQANALVSHAVKIDPQHTAAWDSEVERAVANALLTKGEEVARTGDATAGAELMKKAISRGATLTSDPDTHARRLAAEGLLIQGEGLTRANKDPDRAMALLDRSIQMVPTAEAYGARAFVLAQRGETDEAIADYDRALSLDPSRWDVQAQRAQFLADKEDWSGALAGYSRALELIRAEQRQVGIISASSTGVADRGTLELLQTQRDERILLKGRAYVCLRMNDPTGAAADYSWILAENPKDAPALLGRATAYQMSGRCDKAIQDLTAALENGSDWHALMLRGKCFGDLGSYDKGLRDLEAAAALKPDDQEVQNLIRSYRQAASRGKSP